MIKLIKRIYNSYKKRYNERRRQTDIEVLWPECKNKAPTLAIARNAFLLHAFYDAAWLDVPPEKIEKIVDSLT